MSPDHGNRVVLYSRVSTTGQAEDGVSLAMQDRKMRDYSSLYGLRVVAHLRDDGYSGKTLERPAVDELRALIDRRDIDGIVVYKLDRLTRSIRDFANLVAELERVGISLYSVEEKLDTTTANGEFFTNLMVLMAQWERRQIGERTKAALAQVKASGRHLGKPPFGYRVQDGKLVKHAAEWRIVKRIRRMSGEGMSLQRIADAMNAEGVPTSVEGGKWHRMTVARTL